MIASNGACTRTIFSLLTVVHCKLVVVIDRISFSWYSVRSQRISGEVS